MSRKDRKSLAALCLGDDSFALKGATRFFASGEFAREIIESIKCKRCSAIIADDALNAGLHRLMSKARRFRTVDRYAVVSVFLTKIKRRSDNRFYLDTVDLPKTRSRQNPYQLHCGTAKIIPIMIKFAD